ncbi:MAG: sulfate ABC transporter permease subunit CysW [Parvibaculaceae bacterium]|nr:sulfate ABC transporter permease subunit CysW [Parvibaculaceae bacterium]
MIVSDRPHRVGSRPWIKWPLIATGGALALLIIGLPIVLIFTSAFSMGVDAYLEKIMEPDTLNSVWLTLLTALIVLPVNIIFGLCAAWAITRFEFPGRQALISLIELPFSISPIVVGVAYLFLYGMQGFWGTFLNAHGLQVMFAIPAIILVSLFVTTPFVAHELIQHMQTQGSDDEEAAMSLGANGLQMFFRVTLPNIRWSLLYGVILCNARAMGEFGAVSVVSGSIRGQTNTLPLQIELLFNDYNVVGAFAASTLLAAIALVTLVAKWLVERYGHEAGQAIASRPDRKD